VIPETLTCRGQVYSRVAIEPVTRTDGSKTQYVVWASACRECGQPFFTTSAASKAALRRGLAVHCPQHQSGGPTPKRLAREGNFIARYGAPLDHFQ
jgi:hypothetical protein